MVPEPPPAHVVVAHAQLVLAAQHDGQQLVVQQRPHVAGVQEVEVVERLVRHLVLVEEARQVARQPLRVLSGGHNRSRMRMCSRRVYRAGSEAGSRLGLDPELEPLTGGKTNKSFWA